MSSCFSVVSAIAAEDADDDRQQGDERAVAQAEHGQQVHGVLLVVKRGGGTPLCTVRPVSQRRRAEPYSRGMKAGCVRRRATLDDARRAPRRRPASACARHRAQAAASASTARSIRSARVAERDADEALEDAVDAEARTGRDHQAVVARRERELRADRGAEVDPHREAALGVRHASTAGGARRRRATRWSRPARR